MNLAAMGSHLGTITMRELSFQFADETGKVPHSQSTAPRRPRNAAEIRRKTAFGQLKIAEEGEGPLGSTRTVDGVRSFADVSTIRSFAADVPGRLPDRFVGRSFDVTKSAQRRLTWQAMYESISQAGEMNKMDSLGRVELPPKEARKRTRRRTLLGGKIVSKDGVYSCDCAIRDISSDGARINISSAVTIANPLFLVDHTSQVMFEAQIVWRNRANAGLKFLERHALNNVETLKLRFSKCS